VSAYAESVEESESGLYYVVRRGRHAVSLVVMPVNGDYVGFDFTGHVVDTGADSTCEILGAAGNCFCMGTRPKSFYLSLQSSPGERVTHPAVFAEMRRHLCAEFGE
jgi:hypothetical protein